MEQKNVERISKAIDLLNAKTNAHNKEVKEFMSEFYNEEMKMIYNTILDAKHCLGLCGNSVPEFKINGYYFKVTTSGHVLVNNQQIEYTRCNLNKKRSYESGDINQLEWGVADYNNATNAFEILLENVEELICDIVTMYREVSEKQSSRLDKVFEGLGIDEPKTKHIKVTVEWI